MPQQFRDGGPVTDYKSCVGPGWARLLDDLHRALAELGQYETLQVKEKFGLLRVYISTSCNSSAMFDVLDRFEELSSHVCERCGSPSDGPSTASTGYWLKTWCTACSAHWKVLQHW